MKVQLKLLHEEDLTRLLADLREQASALILVRSCDVRACRRRMPERKRRRRAGDAGGRVPDRLGHAARGCRK